MAKELLNLMRTGLQSGPAFWKTDSFRSNFGQRLSKSTSLRKYSFVSLHCTQVWRCSPQNDIETHRTNTDDRERITHARQTHMLLQNSLWSFVRMDWPQRNKIETSASAWIDRTLEKGEGTICLVTEKKHIKHPFSHSQFIPFISFPFLLKTEAV